MVASASSSNTQCPSGCCKASSARVAASMLRSTADAGVATTSGSTDMRFIASLIMRGDEIGRPIAGPDRAFDRRRQAGLGPIAGEEQIAPGGLRRPALGILARRRREGRAALAHDLPWRQRLGKTGDGRDLLAKLSRASVSRGTSSRRSAALMVTDNAVGKREQPFDGAVHDADDGGKAGGRIDAEMRVDDGAELRRRRRARARDPPRPPAAPPGSRRRRSSASLSVAEIERGDLAVGEIERAQPVSELRPVTFALGEKAQRRLDEDVAQAVASDERPAGLAPREQRLADDGAGEARARLLRLGVERREPERPRETLVERTRASSPSRRSVLAPEANSRRANAR